MKSKRLSCSEREDIAERYQKGDSVLSLSREFDISSQSIYSLLKTRGIKREKRKYKHNEQYFDQIDTEEKAYWLGFFFADGTIDRNTFGFHIGKMDEPHLHLFTKALASDHAITQTESGCRIRIHSPHILSSMLKYGLRSPKSLNLVYPSFLSLDLQLDFIRGFFDGDGWVSGNAKQSTVGFASCSKEFLTAIQSALCEKIEAKRGSIICRKRAHIPGQNNNYRLQFCGNKSCMQVLSAMYGRSNMNTRLDRKYNRYLELLSNIGI